MHQDWEIRTILIQEGHQIAYIGKFLVPKQQALSTYKREKIIILHTITKWKHYLIKAF